MEIVFVIGVAIVSYPFLRLVIPLLSYVYKHLLIIVVMYFDLPPLKFSCCTKTLKF